VGVGADCGVVVTGEEIVDALFLNKIRPLKERRVSPENRKKRENGENFFLENGNF